MAGKCIALILILKILNNGRVYGMGVLEREFNFEIRNKTE